MDQKRAQERGSVLHLSKVLNFCILAPGWNLDLK